MKSMMKLIHIFSVIVFLLMLGVQGVLPVKADAPDQTITIVINAPSTAADGESFTVDATSDSGLTVTYSAAGVCTNVGATFTMTSASGICTVQYNQAGDEIYDPAPQLTDQVTAQEQHATPTQRAPHSITTSAVETFYVSPNGNDANSCTNPNEACLTIPAAITKADDGEAGDTVYVATGTYTISNTIDEVLSIWIGITLSGGWNTDFTLQNDLSIIDGQNKAQGIIGGCTFGPITIDHFKIQNSFGPSIEHCSSLTINNSVISDNYSLGQGSAIFSDGDLTLNNTTVENNISVQNNGAIEVYVSHSLTINNSTITGNQGGGIVYNSSSSPAQITNINNSTITNNKSNVGGGLLISGISPAPVINLRNSIIAGNSADSGPDCSGTISISDHSIIGYMSGCAINTNTGSKLNMNPIISSYPTGQLHYRVLFSGSPAIDAGNPATCLLTDQRQLSRQDGDGNGPIVCDIGAYEYNPTPGPATSLTISSGSNQHAIPGTGFAQPLIVSVLDDDGTPVAGITVTFTAPDSGPTGTFANGANITSAMTNSNGLAIPTTFTANSELGSYNVSASAPGLSIVDFSLANIVWFVSPTGSDTNTCDSSSTACLTINGAIAQATSGDSIYVAAGTYTGSGSQVVNIPQNIQILGGWDETFTTQNGQSIIDGQNERDGIYIAGRVNLSQITVRNSFVGIENDGISTLKQSALINNNNAIHNDGIITVINSTMSGNTYHAISNIGIVKIQYSTITNNKGSYALWGISGNLIELGDSILAGNPGGDCAAGKSNMKSKGYNIFGSSCYSLGAPAFVPLNTDQTVSNLVMSPLTPAGYHLILAGSAPINHANPSTCASLATDQRGMVRPQGGQCDIGAYEYTLGTTPTTIGYSKGSNQNGLVSTPFTTLFEAFVLDGNGSPVKDVMVTFTAPPASGTSGKFADTHTNTTTVATNSSGMAIAPAFTPNNFSGNYNVSAVASGVSGSVTFTLKNLPIPVPILPANVVKDNTPMFKWWKISEATKYQYQVWKGSTLIYSRITSSSICSALTCQVTPTTILGFGSYKWKVQAMIGSVWQTYSAQQAFSIPLMAKAGLWAGGGMDFYINPSHTAVKNFAIYVYIGGCGIYKIAYTLPLTITANKDFKFTGRFYATGKFDTETHAHGDLGLKSYYLKGCGYLTGGPFSWTASWKNGTQPTVIQAEVVPMPFGPQPDDSPTYFTVERVVGP